jgi:hypothetical protein
MTNEMPDNAAIQFATHFYMAVGEGISLKGAFEMGCNQLKLLKIQQSLVPKLNVRPKINPSNVFLVTEESGSRSANPPPTSPTAPAYPASSPAPPVSVSAEFQPFGRWRVQLSDMVRSVMMLELFENGTFQLVQTSQMAPMAAEAVGRWVYVPYTGTLQIQGVINGFAPMALTIIIQTREGDGYRGVGSDGFSYFFERA